MNLKKVNRVLQKRFGSAVKASFADGMITVSGHLPKWSDVVEACSSAATKYSKIHVVNDIVCDEVKEQTMRMPKITDKSLDGQKPDVLIIGGGISGVSMED